MSLDGAASASGLWTASESARCEACQYVARYHSLEHLARVETSGGHLAATIGDGPLKATNLVGSPAVCVSYSQGRAREQPDRRHATRVVVRSCEQPGLCPVRIHIG